MEFPAQYARTRRFSLGAPRNVAVAGNGRFVYFLRPRRPADSVLCLWRLDPASGAEELLADPRTLFDDEALDRLPSAERARRERARESAEGIVDYSTSVDGETVAFALNGELFVVRGDTPRRLSVASGVYDPRLTPAGDAVAFVVGNSLRRVDLLTDADGALAEQQSVTERTIASDDDPLVSWGKAEFVAAEEMNRSRGFWWAPDGRRLLACRVDNTPVDAWWIADPANPERPPQQVRYPAAGTLNAHVELWVIDDHLPVRQVDWSDAGRFEYLNDIVWTSGHQPLVVRQTRDQRTVSIADIDLDTGEVNERRCINDDVWVECITGSPCWAGDDLLTIEDRCDADGDRRSLCINGRPITDPELQVRSILGSVTNAGTDQLVISAWTDPTEIHLATVTLPPPGADRDDTDRDNADRDDADRDDADASVTARLDWITTDAGVHAASVGGDVLAITSLSPTVPGPTVSVRHLSDATNGTTIDSFVETPVIASRPRWLGSGSQLRSALLLPTGHDGSEVLPVLLDPYGGPHAQRVLKSHNAHLVSQWFADQGFAVIVTDGRGTPGRGPSFERAVWGDLAEPVLADQLSALDRIAEETGLLDLNRVGIRGWSFGGYLAALAVLRRPDRVHVAVAGAPVTTWRLYDTHYTERYLGHPNDHPGHYQQTDLIVEAHRLERPLLLVHGLADDNVVAAHTLRLSSALLASGRLHSVLPLSGVTHMTPQIATAENLLRVELDFLSAALGPLRPVSIGAPGDREAS